MEMTTTQTVSTATDVFKEDGTWICARCGRQIDPTTSLYIRTRPGRRALVWHPACPPANNNEASS